MSQLQKTGLRKYFPILEKLITDKVCKVECDLADIRTISDGVKKEKVKWVKKARWPKGKALEINVRNDKDYIGLEFRMIEDTSVNNL